MALQRRQLVVLGSAFGLSQGIVLSMLESARAAGGRTRPDLAKVVADPAKLATLRGAVKGMKDRSKADKHDPLGWDYWAAVHATDVQPPANLQQVYNQCDHSAPDGSYIALHFLSWHRAFLIFFEMALQQAASKLQGSPTLDLPYWDYYTSPKIPAAFTTGTQASNPLWHDRDNTDLTGAGLSTKLPKFDTMLPGGKVSFRKSFTFNIESNPHSLVHGAIGGDMGSIQTSARDPIFWVHHANIDRLWTAWMKAKKRTLPADNSPWAGKAWSFDTANKWKQVAGAMLDEDKLGYGYEDESLPTSASTLVATNNVATTIVAHQSAGLMTVQANTPAAVPPAGGGSTPLSFSPAPVSLGNSTVAVQLGLGTQHKNQLMAFTQTPQTSPIKSADLVLQDIKIVGKKTFSFDVQVSTASGASISLGSLNSFTLSTLAHKGGDHKHDAGAAQTIRYPLAPILNDLGVTSVDHIGEGLTVTFVPEHPVKTGETEASVSIGTVKIEASTAAK